MTPSVLPRRAQRLAERMREAAFDEFDRAFDRLWADIDRRLMHEADRAHTAGQAPYFDARRVFGAGAAGVHARFRDALADSLSALRPWRPPAAVATPQALDALALVDHDDMQDLTVLQAIASRHAARASLGLHLLGQRMAVLACAPAIDAEALPLGPYRLCDAFADAMRPLPLEPEMRFMAYRSFDHSALASYAGFVETLNTLLDREDVLPGLAFVPLRVRPTVQAAAGEAESAAPRPPAPAPFDGWQPPPASGTAATGFDALRRLLADHHHRTPAPADPLPAHGAGMNAGPAPVPAPQARGAHASPVHAATLSTGALLDGIAQLQRHGSTPAAPAPRTPGASLQGLRDALLAQAAQATGAPAALSAEDSDTFELLGLLFAQIGRELRGGGAGQDLLAQLEVPMARLALQDRGFFAEDTHPARRLLNTVAEAHAACLEDDPDPQTRAALQDTVEELAADPQGAAGAFDRANQRMEAHLQMLARKAELAERRQVEAARGKEKLALAKRAAEAVVAHAAGTLALPQFVRTLLEKTWQDVLTLSWLRHGEDSAHWHSRVATTAEIVTLHAPGGGATAAVGLQSRIEEALQLVGHAPAQAASVARRLVSGVDPGDPEAEAAPLAVRAPGAEEAAREALPPRSAAEEDAYRRLRSLPFGTWFDFVVNQQGDVVRRRMSWYSVITGNALFVNTRGQRAAEHTLDGLARLLASGQARIVTVTRARLIDRAWQATLDTLRAAPRAIAGAAS